TLLRQPTQHHSCQVHLHFLLTLPRAPTSTLFPYTTLFRSRLEAVRHEQRRHGLFVGYDRLCRGRPDEEGTERAAAGEPTNSPCRDRKSTRLNSSHRTISYAVFCLKKKKNIYILERHETANG